MPEAEKEKMLAVPLCGERVVRRLEEAGISRLAELAGEDPDELLFRVNLAAGRAVWRPPMATRALANLVRAAGDEARSGG